MANASKLLLDLTTEFLSRGTTVRFRPSGRSMYPSIREGELITVEPVVPNDVTLGDIVLYRSQRGLIAHRVIQVSRPQAEPNAFGAAGFRLACLACGPLQAKAPWGSSRRAMPPSAGTNPLRQTRF